MAPSTSHLRRLYRSLQKNMLLLAVYAAWQCATLFPALPDYNHRPSLLLSPGEISISSGVNCVCRERLSVNWLARQANISDGLAFLDIELKQKVMFRIQVS